MLFPQLKPPSKLPSSNPIAAAEDAKLTSAADDWPFVRLASHQIFY
jgi:hypothetical protein